MLFRSMCAAPIRGQDAEAPDESKSKWDVYKLIRAVPAEQAFRAPADSGCPLVAK